LVDNILAGVNGIEFGWRWESYWEGLSLCLRDMWKQRSIVRSGRWNPRLLRTRHCPSAV